MKELRVNVIGAGLAGSEATYQLIKRGIKVDLYEMRPVKHTEVHKTDLFSELVCSNSLRARSIENAVGLLKEEMLLLDSIIMKAALANEVSAGGALAVDRVGFSQYITDYLKNHPLVEFHNEEVKTIPSGPTIIATGPLTSDSLAKEIQKLTSDDYLYFFDAVAPIVLAESINMDKVYLKSRYDKGEAAYLNCPMTEEEFEKFYEFLVNAERVVPKEFELKVFEGCMPIEEMARRGKKTLLFGPLKPVGLEHLKTGIMPYAVVQLRQDDAAKTMYNLVGFQTNLKWGEQKKLIQMIPGLENAEIVRYGVMHRNTYINSPKVLNQYYQVKERLDLFFAGQITGVEGYVESASSGLLAGINMAHYLLGKSLVDFTPKTAIGSLSHYISKPHHDFQPMNVNYGIIEPLDFSHKKKDRKMLIAKRAFEIINQKVSEEL